MPHPGPQEALLMISETHRMMLEMHERQDRLERSVFLPERVEQARIHAEGVRQAAHEAIRRAKQGT